jgi:hypothetical protein
MVYFMWGFCEFHAYEDSSRGLLYFDVVSHHYTASQSRRPRLKIPKLISKTLGELKLRDKVYKTNVTPRNYTWTGLLLNRTSSAVRLPVTAMCPCREAVAESLTTSWRIFWSRYNTNWTHRNGSEKCHISLRTIHFVSQQMRVPNASQMLQAFAHNGNFYRTPERHFTILTWMMK